MENEDKIEALEEIKNMSSEDVLEFLYEISDTWKKDKDPLEKLKETLRSMIRRLKEDKFDKMNQYFLID